MLNLTAQVSWQYGNYAPASDPNAALETSMRMLQGLITDWTPVFEKVALEVLEPEIERQFASEGRRFETQWEDLAESTVKKRGGSRHPILTETSNLRDSFHTGGGDHVQEITPNEMAWGSAVPYALFHQTGTGGGYSVGRSRTMNKLNSLLREMLAGGRGRRMPARPIIVTTPSLVAKIKRQFTKAIWNTARQAKFETQGFGGFSEGGAGLDSTVESMGDAFGSE